MVRQDVLKWLKENKRLTVLMGIAVSLFLAVQFRGEEQPEKQSESLQPERTEVAAAPFRKEYKSSQAPDDPFRLRTVRNEEKTESLQAVVEMKKTGAADKKAAPVLPVLRGVAQGNGRQVAIIELGVESKAVQAGEVIGAYELLELNGDCASLKGPQGLLILNREEAAR